MSSDLQWLLVRNNNSFLVKRDGVQFSSEPGNLTNLNSFKFSGLANKNTVGLKTVQLKNKKGAVVSKIALVKSSGNKKDAVDVFAKAAPARAAKAIRKATAASYFRGDLTKFAVARLHAITKSLQPVTAKKQQKRRRAGKAVAAKAKKSE